MTFGRSTVSGDRSTFAIGQGGVSAELKSAAEKGLNKAGLMLFMQPGSRRGCV